MKKIFITFVLIVSMFMFIPTYNCETYTETQIVEKLDDTKSYVNDLANILSSVSTYAEDTRVLFNKTFLNSLKGKTYQEKYDAVYDKLTSSEVKEILDENETNIINDFTKIRETINIVNTYLLSNSEDGVLGENVDDVFKKIKTILNGTNIKESLNVYYDLYYNEINNFINNSSDIDDIDELIINDSNELINVYEYLITEEFNFNELYSEYNLEDYESSFKSFINFSSLDNNINNIISNLNTKMTTLKNNELSNCTKNNDYKDLVTKLNNVKTSINEKITYFENINTFKFLNDDFDKYITDVNSDFNTIVEDVKKNVTFNIIILTSNGGSITVDKNSYKYGETVSVTSSVNDGYVFNKLQVFKTDNTDITDDVQTGKYTFEMPYNDVRVKAVFTELAPMSKPNVVVTYGPKNSLVFTWDDDVNAEKYEIYRCETKEGVYGLIKTVTTPTYTDTGLVYGKTYYYIVKAVNQYNEKVTSAKIAAKAIPEGVTASVGSYNYRAVNIRWTKNTSVSGYVIYRSTSENGKYKAIKTITKNTTTSYTNSYLTVGTRYYYKVRTYKIVNGKKIYGRYSNIISEKVRPKPVTFSVSGNTASSVKLTWNKVSGASGYRIYECTSSDASSCNTFVKGVSSKYLSTTITGLETGDGHYYIVRAFRTRNGKKYYSDRVTPKEVIVVPKKVVYKTKQIDETTLKLIFTKENDNFITQIMVDGAIYNTLGNSYTISDLVLGQTYTIQLVAFDDSTMTKSSKVTFTYTCKPAKTSITSLKALGGWKVKVNIVDTGADYYEIYRKEKGGWYLYINKMTSTSYVDDTAHRGVTYYYKVRSVKNGVKSDFSDPVKIVAK